MERFYEIWFWMPLLQSIEKVQILLQSHKIIGHITWISVCAYIVESSAEYFVARQQFEGNPSLPFCGSTQQFLQWLTGLCGLTVQRNALLLFYDNTSSCLLLRGTYIWTMHREHIAACAWRQWLGERATMLRYTYVFYLVLARSELKNHVLHPLVVGKVQNNFINLVFKCCVIDIHKNP
jgi:hypothetical protein